MNNIRFTKRAYKDMQILKRVGLENKIKSLLKIIQDNPFQNPPPYEKMSGYTNVYSRRINKQHRLVYEVNEGIILIAKMWSHYE